MRRGSRRLRGERGVAMVEFALVVPLLLLVAVGLLQFGRVFYYWITTNHLANEGARWAAVDCAPATSGCGLGAGNLQQYIYDNAGISGNTELQSGAGSGLKVCIIPPVSVGDPVTFKVQKRFTFLPYGLGAMKVDINGSSTMKAEFFRASGGTAPSYSSVNNIGVCS